MTRDRAATRPWPSPSSSRALAGAISGSLDYRAIPVAFLLAVVFVASPVGRHAASPRSRPQTGIITIAPVWSSSGHQPWRGHLSDPGTALVTFVCYAVFVGFGEEIMYRGFVQSRLNQAFGRPFQFFGVPWGWGLILTSLLFGFTHVLNVDAASGQTGWYWGWGLWTAVAGLTSGYIRERTGNVLAPAILHGLPQALAAALLAL